MGGNTEGAPACENTLQREYRVVRIHTPIHKHSQSLEINTATLAVCSAKQTPAVWTKFIFLWN